jgi:ribosomal protein S18 acetylase RimI-like enzyme
MNIRKANQKDIEKTSELCAELAKFEYGIDPFFKVFSKKAVKNFKSYVKKGINKKDKFILVAETQNQIVGFVYCEIKKRPGMFILKKIGYIVDIFILPKFRKKGTGTILIKNAIKKFKQNKIKFVQINSLTGNKKAIRLYKKIGFKEYEKQLRKKI